MPLEIINTFEGYNMGGFAPRSIVLLPMQNIVAQTPLNVTYTEAFSIYYTPDTAQHNQAGEEDKKQGDYFKQEISFIIPQQRDNVDNFVNKYGKSLFYVKYKDKNGKDREFSNAKLTVKTETGRQGENLNHYEFTIRAETKNLAAPARTLLQAPTISVSPSLLDFEIVSTGDTAQLSFFITNTGESTLVVSNITVPNLAYSLSWTSGNIAPSASQEVIVTFAPLAPLQINGNIVIASNAANNDAVVSVTGLGYEERLTAFNGVANKVQTSVPAMTFPYASAYTISCFLLTPDAFITTYYFIFSHTNPNDGIFAGIESQKLMFGRLTGGAIQKIIGTTLLTPNTLYKVDFVSEGAGYANLKIYLNGILYATIPQGTQGIINSGAPSVNFCIGMYGGSQIPFKGNIGYLRAYNKALSELEITEQLNSLSPLNIPELVHAWECQETQGISTRADSISGATGTLIGYTAGELATAQRDINNNHI